MKRIGDGLLKRGVGAAAVASVLLAAALPVFGAEPEEAQFNVVAGLYNAGQWQAAVAKIAEREKTELTEGMRAKYLLAKGMAYEKGQKGDEARAAYEELLSKYAGAAEAQQARVAVIYLDYARGEAKGAGEAVLGNIGKLDIAKLSAGDKKNLLLMKAEVLYTRAADAASNKAALDAYAAALAAGADATAMAAKVFDLYSRLGMNAELVAHSANGVTGVQAETVALVRGQAFLVLGKFPEAQAEAGKVGSGHALYAKASYVKAQAMLKQGLLKEAVSPLEAAIAGMKDPAAPVMAHLALVECLIEAGRGEDAARALSKARVAVDVGPEDQKAALKGQLALLDVRLAAAGTDRQKVIDAVTRARGTVAREQLSKLLYLRLVKLSEGKDPSEVLGTLGTDMAVFEASPEYGAAAAVYASAFKKAGKAEEGVKVLTAYVAKQPETVEGLKARVWLASEALGKNDFAGAAGQLDAVIAAAGAAEKLGKDVFDEALFNRGVAAEKLNDQAGAVKAFAALAARSPQQSVARRTALQLGQAYAAQKDYGNAAAVWKKALADGVENEADVRDRLARVLFAAKDYAGAVEQVGLGVKAAGGAEKVSKESREVWARSQFALNKFGEAGGVFAGLAGQYKEMPGYAFEAGMAYEKAGDLASAEKWYAVAAEGKGKLSVEYAGVVDAKVAGMRLTSGAGDMGASRWLGQIAEAKDGKGFETAAGALRKIAAAGKLDAAGQEKLKGVMDGLAVTDAKKYALGGIIVEARLGLGQVKEAGALADALLPEFAKNEKGLDAKSSGATVAPAVFYFAQGEALRARQDYPAALAAYETVLAAYPVNHWPDAAACGAGECLVALGDKSGAVEKFKEVVKSAGTQGAGKVWRERAEMRLKAIGG